MNQPPNHSPVSAMESARESDSYLLSLLRDGRTLSVDELKEGLGVTATAVRQRIERLLAAGLIEREKVVAGRGRPIFRYRLTVDGHRQAGADVTEFAEAMWLEIMNLRDSPIRRRLVSAIARRLGRMYASKAAAHLADLGAAGVASASSENTVAAAGMSAVELRMRSLSHLLARNQIDSDVHVAHSDSVLGGLPVLDIGACPYPTLRHAPDDRSLCKLEEEMFSEALGQAVQLTSCRLDGDTCCQFSVVTKQDGESLKQTEHTQRDGKQSTTSHPRESSSHEVGPLSASQSTFRIGPERSGSERASRDQAPVSSP